MTESAYRTAAMFKILGNPLRFKILCELLVSPLSPSHLAHRVHRPLPAVSRALALLHHADLVEYRTHGHGVLYSIKHDAIGALLHHGEVLVHRFDRSAARSPAGVPNAAVRPSLRKAPPS